MQAELPSSLAVHYPPNQKVTHAEQNGENSQI